MKRIILILAIVIITAGAAVVSNISNYNVSVKNNKAIIAEMTLYKDPNCGCCSGYAEALRNIGVKVNIIETDKMSDIKSKYNIQPDMQSCHTITYGRYFIEGHVPMEAVLKLIKTQPDIEGIGLPRMPSGTPGMPGPKYAPYEVYQLINGKVSEYITI